MAGGESRTLKVDKSHLPPSKERLDVIISCLYLAVSVMNLKSDSLPIQLHPLGEHQLGAMLILTDEPLT